MEARFEAFTLFVALVVEALAALIVAAGALEAIVSLGGRAHLRERISGRRKVWVRFGVWLLLGLEFELAADIVRTAISPTWDQLGQLACIAVIRTFLNHFLEKDIEKYQEANPGTVSTVNERAA